MENLKNRVICWECRRYLRFFQGISTLNPSRIECVVNVAGQNHNFYYFKYDTNAIIPKNILWTTLFTVLYSGVHMKNIALFAILFLTVVAGCARKSPEPIAVRIPSRPIDYQNEIKSLLDKRCAVCHSCYNSPCQLKLSSYEGVDRGASKRPVYNATRMTTMGPTRLFVDAHSIEEWRKKNFHTVTESKAADGLNNSLMLQILDHKMKNPAVTGEYRLEANDLTCSETSIELDGYLFKHPNRGMPFGFPPLEKDEFEADCRVAGTGC